MKRSILCILGSGLLLIPAAFAATDSGTTQLSVTVPVEAAITVNTGTTTLATSGTTFANPFTGSTSLAYKVRTTATGGAGNITVYISTDFNGDTNGPRAAKSGDELTYSCGVTGVGTACTGPVTVGTTSGGATNVVTFAADARSAKTGDSATVTWSLPNDPQYPTGTYTATATFTISSN